MVVKRGKTELTDEEKYQLALQSEIECDRLRRQCTLLERDRTQFVQGKDKTILRQRRVLKVYQDEHKNIVTDLKVATTLEKKRQDHRNIENLSSQLTTHDCYQKSIDKIKVELREIDGQIKILINELRQLESENVSDYQIDERLRNDCKSLKLMENQLQVEMRRFCLFTNENQKLRQLIEHLLLERRDFMKIWTKLINKLTRGKKFMLDIIEQATIACDQREEWCKRLNTLRSKAHKDLLIQTELMCNYVRKQDNDKKLEHFLLVKNQKRVTNFFGIKRLMKLREQRENLENQLRVYQGMHDDILEFTEETDIDMIANKFFRQEIENFVNFQYINDLNNELEHLNVYLEKLYLRNDQQKTSFDERNAQQEDKIKNLEDTLENMKEQTISIEDDLHEQETTLEQILTNITAMFQKCQCSNEQLSNLLGDISQIDYYNVISYLEILENRVHSLSLMALFKGKIAHGKRHDHKPTSEDQEEGNILAIKEIVPTNPCPL